MVKDKGLKKKIMAAELDLPKLQEVRTWHTRQVERVKVKEVEIPALKEEVENVKVKESFIVKEEVMQTLMKSDVGLVEEMVQWLAADPKVQFIFISSSNHRQSHQQLIAASVINLINRFAHSGLSLLNN